MTMQNIVEEEWEIVMQGVGAIQFDKWQTNPNILNIKTGPTLRNGFKEIIINCRNNNNNNNNTNNTDPQMYRTTRKCYYLNPEETLQMFGARAIKLNNKRMSTKELATHRSDVGACVIESIRRIIQTKQDIYCTNLKEEIKKCIAMKICRIHQQQPLEALPLEYHHMPKYDDGYVYFITDCLISMPLNNTCRITKIYVTTSRLDIEACELEGKQSVLNSSSFKASDAEIQNEYNRKHWNLFLDETVQSQCELIQTKTKDFMAETNQIRKWYLKLMTSGSQEYKISKSLEFQNLLHQTWASLELRSGWYKALPRLWHQHCNICGLSTNDSRAIRNIAIDSPMDATWILSCPTHGRCHSSCSPYASLMCPHC
eukprot:127424_1